MAHARRSRVVNAVAWAVSTRAYVRRRRVLPAVSARWPHLLLSGGYVLGCGFRGLLPRADVQRIVLVDSWLSSVLVGRSVATVAELCFAAQWALLLRELAAPRRNALGFGVARMIVPMIFVAELCSWYALLSTSYLATRSSSRSGRHRRAADARAARAVVGVARGDRVFLSAAILVSACFVGSWHRRRAHVLFRFVAAMRRGAATLPSPRAFETLHTLGGHPRAFRLAGGDGLDGALLQRRGVGEHRARSRAAGRAGRSARSSRGRSERDGLGRRCGALREPVGDHALAQPAL